MAGRPAAVVFRIRIVERLPVDTCDAPTRPERCFKQHLRRHDARSPRAFSLVNRRRRIFSLNRLASNMISGCVPRVSGRMGQRHALPEEDGYHGHDDHAPKSHGVSVHYRTIIRAKPTSLDCPKSSSHRAAMVTRSGQPGDVRYLNDLPEQEPQTWQRRPCRWASNEHASAGQKGRVQSWTSPANVLMVRKLSPMCLTLVESRSFGKVVRPARHGCIDRTYAAAWKQRQQEACSRSPVIHMHLQRATPAGQSSRRRHEICAKQ